MSTPPIVYFGVDAGGSHTSTMAWVNGRTMSRRCPSLNPASVGEEVARSGWADLLRWIASQGGTDSPINGWIGAAGFDRPSLVRRVDLLRGAAVDAGIRGTMCLTNDLVPPLLGPPLWGHGIVVVVGTGSSVLGRSRDGAAVRVGGYEYLLSDEGGGFDMGLKGLRAAARAYDGRGPNTTLLDAVREAYGVPIPDLGQQLAETPRPKLGVARFAEHVCRMWVRGDAVAAGIVQSSIEEMSQCASRVAKTLELLDGVPCAVVGSIPVGCYPYLNLLRDELASIGIRPATLIASPADVALELARSDRTFRREQPDTIPIACIDVEARA